MPPWRRGGWRIMMFTIDSIEWENGFNSLPQIRRDFPEYKWIAIDSDGEVVVHREKPRWDGEWDLWIGSVDSYIIATCRIIEGHAKDTLRRL